MAQHPAYSLLWHLTLAYELHGQKCQNGFYFSNRISLHDQEAWIASAGELLNSHFFFFMFPAFQAFMSQQVHFTGQLVQQLIPGEGPIWERPTANETGDQQDESLPSYVAAIVSCRTGLGGKSNRGRIYVAGVPEDAHTDSQLDLISHGVFSIIGEQLLSQYGPTGSEGHFHHVIFSKKHGYSNGVFSTTGIRPITHYLCRKDLGTQRHRLKGKGN